MKTQRKILVAFVLNMLFSIFEFIGGTITGSVAIISDAIHDLGDVASIGVSLFLERKSRKQPDEIYTYGYTRYSVIGGVVTTLVLILASAAVIYNAVGRILKPMPINYSGMIVFAVVGVLVNVCAAWFTRGGESINQRAVNLHMLEDVLGWIVVLIGALIMRFTNFYIIDPLMSIGVAVFIMINAVKTLKEVLDLFLERIPKDISVEDIKSHILEIDGVEDVHHVHIWSLDGKNNYATMHVVTDENAHDIKEKIRHELAECSIGHVTLELESNEEHCHEKQCHTDVDTQGHCHHHHH